MTAEFTFRKLKWLNTIARDNAMPRSSVTLAALFATEYFNSKSGEAWPAMSTLAGDLGVTEATVVAAIQKLVVAKYLCRESGGARTTNRYSIPDQWEPQQDVYSAIHQTYTEQYGSRIADGTSDVYSAIHNTENETENRTSELTPQRRARKINSASGLRGDEKPSSLERKRSSRRMPLPDGWECGDAEIAEAKSIASWTAERARREFEKFLDFHRDKDTRGTSWPRFWRNWCRQGVEIDQREKKNRPHTPARRPSTDIRSVALSPSSG